MTLARLTIVGRFCETPRRLAQTPYKFITFVIVSSFDIRASSFSSLSERRGHFRARWRLKFKRGRRNRRTRLVRIRGDDPVAVR